MRKLLVPVDGSECSARALDYALRLASGHPGVALHLLNVHHDPVVYGELQVYVPRERMLELQRKQGEAVLAPAAEKAKAAGVPCTTEVRSGDVATIIAECADELKCDGIVMGTRGMGVIGNLFLGSVATKVVHLANVPVTLVK